MPARCDSRRRDQFLQSLLHKHIADFQLPIAD